MRGPPLGEFQDANELGRLRIFAPEVFPKPVKDQSNVFNLLPLVLDLRFVQRQGQEITKIESLRLLSDTVVL